MNSLTSRKVAMVFILVFQVILIVIYGVFAKYDAIAIPPSEAPVWHNFTTPAPVHEPDIYPLFQDIHVMIFVGFGFLMTFLKKYAFSALGFTFLVAAMVIQWAIIVHAFLRFHSIHDKIHVSIVSIMNADIAAAVILISLGAVLGKISPLQLLVMAILETVLFAGNEYLGTEVLKAADAGGSVYVHVFGAYFGLAVSFMLARGVSVEGMHNNLESSSYQSDVTSMIGTLFLWMFWPSFNAGLLFGDEKYRAIINTYLALTASCLTTFAMSSILTQGRKFEMVHVQNATLAGGVCVGSSVNMMIQPYGALIIGAFAGVLSTVGFRFIQGFLHRKLRIHDTCGVNNLHGMPGLVAGLVGAIAMAFANHNTYGYKWTDIFPGLEHRDPKEQACYQVINVLTTLSISIAGGLVTGVLLRYAFPKVQPEEYYDDDVWWKMEEEEA